MRYEKPILECIKLETEDLIRTSTLDWEERGDENGSEGPWGK